MFRVQFSQSSAQLLSEYGISPTTGQLRMHSAAAAGLAAGGGLGLLHEFSPGADGRDAEDAALHDVGTAL
ncbi:unnamed protein product [Nippostrongylus brasiliensis]|uniref:TetR family transcriptional regulator n=1 Tax=Nippostrongylus brasiliensis TaxID=27835 RepID=A0A0N4YNX3_NIPBR|nr:unnamed protein product [Nippostrongylus brasiliensis]